MRYYSITLSDPKTGQSLVLDNSGGFTLLAAAGIFLT